MRGWWLVALGVLLATPLDAALAALVPQLLQDSQASWLGAGFAAGVLGACVLAWRVPFLLVLDHEIAHLLAAVLCLRRPVGLRVGEETGLAEYSAGRGRTLILLAPYGWPWAAWVLCLSRFVLRPELFDALAAAIGLALGFEGVRVALDLRPHQSDLRRVGLARSGLAVLAWGPLLFAAPALFALGGVEWWVPWWRGAEAVVRGWVAALG